MNKYKDKHEHYLSECFSFKAYLPLWWLKQDLLKVTAFCHLILAKGGMAECPCTNQIVYRCGD